MKRLNGIQNINNIHVAVYYCENKGSFHICSKDKIVANHDYAIVIKTHTNIADSFVSWASKINNLSNQPDKNFDYTGDRPIISKIRSDWQIFKTVYESIIIK